MFFLLLLQSTYSSFFLGSSVFIATTVLVLFIFYFCLFLSTFFVSVHPSVLELFFSLDKTTKIKKKIAFCLRTFVRLFLIMRALFFFKPKKNLFPSVRFLQNRQTGRTDKHCHCPKKRRLEFLYTTICLILYRRLVVEGVTECTLD